VPKTSLHRLLRTLESGGFLERSGTAYRPGPESFRLGRLLTAATPDLAFPACARATLERLAAATGETVMLSELSERGTESVYVEVIESSAELRFTMRPGNRRPLYSVASGKAMLAFLPADAQESYAAQADFIAFTPHTTSRDALPATLAGIRRTGIAVDSHGMVEGVAAMASPVFDADGVPFAAVSVAGPSGRIEAGTARFTPLVREAGEHISRLLGYNGVYPPASV